MNQQKWQAEDLDEFDEELSTWTLDDLDGALKRTPPRAGRDELGWFSLAERSTHYTDQVDKRYSTGKCRNRSRQYSTATSKRRLSSPVSGAP